MINNKLHISVSGQGPDLVLLHGWGLHGGIWQTLLPQLEKYYTVHNVDMPGFGRSVGMWESLEVDSELNYNLEFLVESITSQLPEHFNLVGWSLGGLVATAIAARYPARVRKLITVASSPCFVASQSWPHAMDQGVLSTFIEYLNKDFKGTLVQFLSIQTMGSNTQKQDISKLKETVFEAGVPSETALKGGLQILKNVNLLSDLAALKMPLLRIYGRLDTLVPVKVVEQIDKLVPNSRSTLFKQSGHAPFLSQTDLFATEVLTFLQAQKTE